MEIQNARWIHAIKAEEKVRMTWYLKNRDLLLASTQIPYKHKVDPKVLDDVRAARKEIYAEAERHPMRVSEEPVPPDPTTTDGGTPSAMKSVPPEINSLIYNSSNKGRVTYLGARVKSLPEDRFTFPICTSFQYGWKMWDCAKTMGGTKCGKSAIIKETFYRRRTGIERDPDWYTVPERMSPTICNCP